MAEVGWQFERKITVGNVATAAIVIGSVFLAWSDIQTQIARHALSIGQNATAIEKALVVATSHSNSRAPHAEAERRISSMEATLEASLAELLRTTQRIEQGVAENRSHIQEILVGKDR